MDGLTLLKEAKSAGLDVLADGDRLVIRGPRSAEAIARRLLAHKPDVMDALAAESAAVPESPGLLLQCIEPDEDAAPRPCATCGGSDLWESLLGVWRCRHCDAAALARSRLLADKAARLREESLRQQQAAERRAGRCPGPAAASGLPAASSGV